MLVINAPVQGSSPCVFSLFEGCIVTSIQADKQVAEISLPVARLISGIIMSLTRR